MIPRRVFSLFAQKGLSQIGSLGVRLSDTVSVAPPPAQVPVNTVLPVINYVQPIYWGQVLTCSSGSWTNTPTSYTYTWVIGGGVVQTGPSNSYTVDIADIAETITCEVTATNEEGDSAPAASMPTPAPVFFEPEHLSGMLAFFRPYDPTSVVLVDNKVSQLTNMAAGATEHLIQATVAAQPSIGTGLLNGLDVLYAPVNGVWLENLDAPSVDATDYTSFVIAYLNSGGNTSGRAFTLAPATATDGSSASFIPFVKSGDGTTYNCQAGTGANAHPVTVSTWHSLTAIRTNTELTSWLDGGDMRSAIPQAPTGTLTRMAMFTNLINGGVGTIKGNGYVFCALLYNRILTTVERQRLEGWGHWKSNLELLLPSDHPYKSARP